MKVYYSWLDRWDEQRARRGEDAKKPTDFVLHPELAFPGAAETASLQAFCDLAGHAVADPTFFDEPSG